MSDPINLEEIIELVRQQEPDPHDLINASQNCTGGHWSRNGYYSIVDSKNANEPNAEWQHDECIVLEQENKRDIVIDLLKSGRIGGIEFINLIGK